MTAPKAMNFFKRTAGEHEEARHLEKILVFSLGVGDKTAHG